MSVLSAKALAFALAFVSIACGGASSSEPPRAAVVPTVVKQPAAAPSPDVRADRAFRQRVQDAQAEARRVGWIPREVVDVPGRRAAIILYDPSTRIAKATKMARYDALAAEGAVLTGESGMIDVVKTKRGDILWDLTGTGADSIVLHLTPCGPHCGQAQPTVLTLTKRGGIVIPPAMPECPTCIQDQDRDRVPEFTYRMFELKIAPCSRASCGPSAALEIEVRGVESFHEGKYARDLRDFIPMYFDRLKEARRVARRVRSAKNKSKICPLNALRIASELYVYGLLIGEEREQAVADANRIMTGYDFENCSKEYDLLGPPKDWPTLREELTSQKLPELTTRRPGNRSR